MKIGIPKEIRPGERRVAATPETVSRLQKLGFEVLVESQAGAGASFGDADYTAIGASIAPGAQSLWDQAEIVLKVQPPEQNLELGVHEAELLREGSTLVSFIWPGKNGELVERLAARRATVLAMDQVPRITRAQKMDALSSMANIAGYRAVIEAASFIRPVFSTGQNDRRGQGPARQSAGHRRGRGRARGHWRRARAGRDRARLRHARRGSRTNPEHGRGVLGSDHQGRWHRLGRLREDHEPRVHRERRWRSLVRQAKDVDIIITTALVPGKAAPVLITEEMVSSMRQGR